MRVSLLFVAALLLTACHDAAAPRDIEVPTEAPAPPASSAPREDASPAAQGDASAAAAPTSEPAPSGNGYACEARGLKTLDPCPGGGDLEAAAANVSLVEGLAMCCASGPVDGVEGQACFSAVEAAEYCKDAAGKRAALARLDAFARRWGEPCKKPGLQDVMRRALRAHLRICMERGFPVPPAPPAR